MAQIDAEQVSLALSWMQPGDVVELRALGVKVKKAFSARTVSGYFDNMPAVIRVLEKIPTSTGIYVTLNPVLPACLARAANRVDWLNDRDTRTADHDILRRVWFPIDCDPVRPRGISSTDAEWELARAKAETVCAWLHERQWPHPMLAHSGNGVHLLYHVDLPNDEMSRDAMQKALQALAFVFDDGAVSIDQTNFNASRIWKLYGTIARKGDDLPDRPNRMSKILAGHPHELVPLTLAQLQTLAKVLLPEPKPDRRLYTGQTDFDLETWIRDYASDAKGPESWNRGRRWRFAVCPWNEEHRDRSAYIVELPGGGIAAGCHHNGCSGQDWQSLRHLRQPERAVRSSGLTTTHRQSPTVRTTAEPKKELYGLEDIVDTKLIWVASKDEKALIQAAGYRSCVVVPDVPPIGANYRKHLAYLRAFETILAPLQKHLFLFPNSLEGRALTQELARRLGPERGMQPQWPSECDSVEHIVTVYGLDLLKETIETAEPMPLPDVIEMRSLRQELHDWYRIGGLPKGVGPGWKTLEKIYRIRPGLVTLITGVPSTGKSSWLSAMLVNLMREHDWAVSIFSPEQAPPTRYASSLVEQWLQKPFDDGPTPRMSLTEMDEALDRLQEHVTLLWPEETSATVDYLLELARQEVFRRSIQGLVIDPWNEVDHLIAAHQREDQYIGQSLTKIRRFARTYGVHVWIVAHPRLISTDPTTKQTPVPSAYDISGGAKWRDKADNVLSLWREFGGAKEYILQVHVQKIRFREDGEIGRKADLYYHKATGTYSDVYDLP